VPQRCDAKLLQVLFRQAWKNRLVYLILAECSSYLPRPRLRSQTTTSMPTSVTEGCRASWSCPEGVSSWALCDLARQPTGSTPYLN
jgi:hypothetical protein